MLKGKPVLLAVTGGIACYKSAGLASALVKRGANVHVLMTRNATEFIGPHTFESLTGNRVSVDTFDRNYPFQVEHIALADQADAVFTPTDNVIMAAAGAVSATFTEAGIPYYTGADSFVTAGALATCGVNYDELGAATADLALEVLQTGTVPEYQILPGGIVTVNTETAAALGLDSHVFDSLGGTLVEVTTAAE